MTAQGGNALNTRLLGNGNGNYGLRSKCWNSWQVNPQAQLPREQVCGKLIAVVLISARVFPPLENTQSFGKIRFCRMVKDGERPPDSFLLGACTDT